MGLPGQGMVRVEERGRCTGDACTCGIRAYTNRPVRCNQRQRSGTQTHCLQSLAQRIAALKFGESGRDLRVIFVDANASPFAPIFPGREGAERVSFRIRPGPVPGRASLHRRGCRTKGSGVNRFERAFIVSAPPVKGISYGQSDRAGCTVMLRYQTFP